MWNGVGAGERKLGRNIHTRGRAPREELRYLVPGQRPGREGRRGTAVGIAATGRRKVMKMKMKMMMIFFS